MYKYESKKNWREEVGEGIKNEMNKHISNPKVDTVKLLDVVTDSEGNKHMDVIVMAGNEISCFELKFIIKK